MECWNIYGLHVWGGHYAIYLAVFWRRSEEQRQHSIAFDIGCTLRIGLEKIQKYLGSPYATVHVFQEFS